MFSRARITGAMLAAVVGIGIGPGIAQEVLRLNIPFQQNSHFGVAADVFADKVAELTDGRYEINNFYNGALGAERESIEAVQLGTLDITFTSTGPVPNFIPELAVLDIPFLFKDYDNARAVLDGPIGQQLLDVFDQYGMHAPAWGENGFRNMTNNVRPIETPADLKGLKMRTMENPIHIRAYEVFGISPTPMAITEVFTALQQGVVDGEENPLSVIISNHFDEVQKYVSMTGHVYAPALFLINENVWAGLSAEDQAAFTEAAQAAVAANRDRVDQDEEDGIASMRAKGVEVLTDIDKQPFIDMLQPLYGEFRTEFGQVMDDIIEAQN